MAAGLADREWSLSLEASRFIFHAPWLRCSGSWRTCLSAAERRECLNLLSKTHKAEPGI
jgi:hypothetical protein